MSAVAAYVLLNGHFHLLRADAARGSCSATKKRHDWLEGKPAGVEDRMN